MLKTKGFVISSYNHRSKNQLGNTLIPVIIALAISAVASVSFLKKGADLSTQAKILEAQYEIADLLQYWNRIKSTKGINNIKVSDLPPMITNNKSIVGLVPGLVLGSPAMGDRLGFTQHNKTFTLVYELNYDAKECLTLASMFSSKMAGISNLQSPGGSSGYISFGNPRCFRGSDYYRLDIRLD
jgi:hypothetical protein